MAKNDKDEKKRAKAEWELQKMQHEADKKRAKAEAKMEKKRIKAGLPPKGADEARAKGERETRSARFADTVRGVLYLVAGLSILVGGLLGRADVIMSLDDIIDHLLVARVGTVLLLVIGVGLCIYGLRKLKVMK